MPFWRRNSIDIPAKVMPEMEIVVSTSHPDGNWANEKNCAWLHSEKPTHGSGPVGCGGDYIGRFFLHFTEDYSLVKIFVSAK